MDDSKRGNGVSRVIYIYSDSTAFPRPDEVRAADTWPFLITEHDTIVYLRGFGGATSTDLLNLIERDSFYFGFTSSKQRAALIFAAGIVDCAPRPITYKLKIISKVPLIGKTMWGMLQRLLHPYRPAIQRIAHYKLVSNHKIEKNLRKIERLVTNPEMQILIIETPTPAEFVLERSPHFRKNVAKINDIKLKICSSNQRNIFVKLQLNDPECYIEDGHHLSVKGHTIVSEKIKEALSWR